MAGCSFVVVVVVVVLAAEESGAQLAFSPFGGMVGVPFGNQQQLQAPPDPLLTCISVNPRDHMAQLRLTVRPDRSSSSAARNGFPFVGLTGLGGPDLNIPQDWVVEGVIVPGSVTTQGTYYVVVTQYGRTVGGTCKAAAMGPAIEGSRIGLGGPFQFPFSSLGGLGGYFMGQGLYPEQQAAGILSNPVVMTQGVSSYMARLHGVSYNEVNGGGIALCPQLHQGQCLGAIPMCCGITRDQVPATQTILQPGSPVNDDLTAFPVSGFNRPAGLGAVNTGFVGGNGFFDNQELGNNGLFGDVTIGADPTEARLF